MVYIIMALPMVKLWKNLLFRKHQSIKISLQRQPKLLLERKTCHIKYEAALIGNPQRCFKVGRHINRMFALHKPFPWPILLSQVVSYIVFLYGVLTVWKTSLSRISVIQNFEMMPELKYSIIGIIGIYLKLYFEQSKRKPDVAYVVFCNILTVTRMSSLLEYLHEQRFPFP